MTPTPTERVLAALLFACMAGLFVLAAWQSQRAFRTQADAYEWRAQVQHIRTHCASRPDGSAECRPNAFARTDGGTTTTTVAK